MWLKELLPVALPNVRIMTFGYNAAFRNFTGHHDIRHIATKLLSELTDLRADEDVSCTLRGTDIKARTHHGLSNFRCFRKFIDVLSSFVTA